MNHFHLPSDAEKETAGEVEYVETLLFDLEQYRLKTCFYCDAPAFHEMLFGWLCSECQYYLEQFKAAEKSTDDFVHLCGDDDFAAEASDCDFCGYCNDSLSSGERQGEENE